MKLDELVAWYQKKIGTYDKQQWEKTVEQKILDGFTNVTLKNTKLKTEFIDVDLVRGSSFPKAKPKQSLLTVIRLAILRYFFLPIYAKWWVTQTSPRIFVALLCLYTTQLFNWGVYSFNIHKIEKDSEHIVSLSELLTPIALSLVLSLIHSLIVATNSSNSTAAKQRKPLLHFGSKSRERVRVLSRHRIKDLNRSTATVVSSPSSHIETYETVQCKKTSTSSSSNISSNGKKVRLRTDAVLAGGPKIKDLDLRQPETMSVKSDDDIITIRTKIDDSPMLVDYLSNGLPANDVTACPSIRIAKANLTLTVHNLNGDVISRGEKSPKTVRIDESVQEFYDDLIQQTDESINDDQINPNPRNVGQRNVEIGQNNAEQAGEDDGFESLNGKSSSGEENQLPDDNNRPSPESPNKNGNQEPLPTTSRSQQLRLRTAFRNSRQDIENEDLANPLTTHPIPPSVNRRKPLSSESDFEKDPKLHRKHYKTVRTLSSSSLQTESSHKKFKTPIDNRMDDSSETDEESDDAEILTGSASISTTNYAECTTSATEWLGITTNSEECSNCSEIEHSDFQNDNEFFDHEYYSPSVLLNPSSGSTDRISCTIWDRHEVKKAEMSVLDISSCIIDRVEAMPETYDYIYIGVIFCVILSMVPSFCRLCEATVDVENSSDINYLEIPALLLEKASFSFSTILRFAFGKTNWESTVLIIGLSQRFSLTFLLFFLLTVAERTFKQRFLYAKLFSHLTSSRRARKSELPHFRLNKVRNIKTWLSVRSYLKRRGPQRSVDVIVSAAFMITFLLLAFLCLEWLKDSVHLHSQLNLEALLWSCALGIFLLRFMTLGTKTNLKYRSTSVLITEQINLYLQIEQNPKKKEALMVSNSVLKLAADLLKELESPFKISGLSANPYLYTTIKVVILSALSGVLSEMLGFKLKLNKIKIK